MGLMKLFHVIRETQPASETSFMLRMLHSAQGPTYYYYDYYFLLKGKSVPLQARSAQRVPGSLLLLLLLLLLQ